MLSIGNLAIQLTTLLLLRKQFKLFASVARVCQRQLGFLVNFVIRIVKVKRLKPSIALNGKPITELLSVTCHMGSQCYLPPDTSERAPS